MDLLDPKLDVVFKSLFLRERSLIAPMLEALLGPPVSIASVEVLNPILPKELVADKEAILDLHVRLDDGHQVDVEMQQLWRPGIPERAAYYVARICASQLRAGQPHEELASSTVVFLLGESRLEALEFHEIFTLIGLRTRRRLTHALNVHMVDMHGHALATPDEVMLRRWCRFFVASSRADLQALAMEDPVMQRAVQTLEALSADAEMQALAEARQKAYASTIIMLGAARKEGREEGRELGREEGLELGREEGLELGRLEAIESIVEVLGLPFDVERRERLRAASADELEALLVELRTLRRWPD